MKRKAFIFLAVIITSCATKALLHQPSLTTVPEGFPEVKFPEGNEFTQARWALGKKLFFDPVLSIDSSISCSTCHRPSLAFSDSVAFSPGVQGRPGTRNAPSLTNIAYHPYFLKEGGVPTLEMQVLVPIQEHNEFAHNIVDIATQLKLRPEYVAMSTAAYARELDAFVITRAIGTFERTILSGNSAYDQFERGDNSALGMGAQRGRDLFFSEKVSCTSCHSGFNFSNYAFENNAQDTTDGDIGRMRVTKVEQDKYLFKVPSLRNAALTAPYMHDGRYRTLQQVVEHYNNGGQANGYPNGKIKALGLSDQEKEDLLAFLQSLTDMEFVERAEWK